MNLKTTIFLAVLVIAGAAVWWLVPFGPPTPSESGSQAILSGDLRPDNLTRVEISHGDRHLLLERKLGQEWTLPGQWPVRKSEIDKLIHTLTSLSTRFAAIALGEPPDLKSYGLADDALQVKLVAGQEHVLLFGEEPGEANRFSRATYLRIDNHGEVLRLAPGLIAELDRPAEYYMQRRLFPGERVAKEGATEKVEQLDARAIRFSGPGGSYDLVRSGTGWELREPFRDRADPDKLQKLLTAAPDIWAEEFVDKKDKQLDDLGLKSPSDKLQVELPGGNKITLLVGKQSSVKVRQVAKPAPPFGPPRPPQVEMVHDEYRYAKLENNDRIFTIKADRLKALAMPADDLRDPRLARFRTDDARRLEVKRDGSDIVLVKDKERWRLHKPTDVDAESSKVTELLDKLSGLEATGKDVVEKGDPKTYGLDRPAVVQVAVEETKGTGDSKTTHKHAFTFHMGKHDKDKKKLYVQVAGWPRINLVDDSLEKLIDRSALAYRGRKVFDYSAADLARIEIRRPGETFSLEQAKGSWRLATPVQAAVDTTKADELARDLGRLEAVEFVTDQPRADDLDKVYGLARPALTATLFFADAKKPAKTVQIGKERKDKEYFARLDSDPAIFVIKKDIHEAVSRDSLAYRSNELWKLAVGDIAELRFHKPEADYQVKHEDSGWKISGPFDAMAVADMAQPMAEALADLRAERFVAHTAKDLGAYGLDKPYLRVAVVPKKDEKAQDKDKEKKAASTPAPESKERVLLIGAQVGKEGKDAQARYARLADGEGIFILPQKTISALDHRALDLLDRNLFSTSFDAIQRVSKKAPDGVWTLQHEKDKWWVVDSPVPPFVADQDETSRAVSTLTNLRAKEYAAYGPKVDLSSFGLDKPATTISFSSPAPDGKDKAAKPISHTLALGKPVKAGGAERYARLDQGPAVAVLDADVVKRLTANYLEFVNHEVLKLPGAEVTGVSWAVSKTFFELSRINNGWRLRKLVDIPTDQPTVESLVKELTNLRALRIAAFPAKDVKELTRFGLGPEAVLRVNIRVNTQGKAVDHRLEIGNAVAAEGETAATERYARADDSAVVAILPADMVRRLTGPVLDFRDRDLARLDGVNQLVLERGLRRAVFTKTDETWKMTEPIQTDAEQSDLEAFVKNLGHLRADALVAERALELKPYGLDRPQARWHVNAGGKELLALEVGGQESTKDKAGRCYARLVNGELVFLLSTELTNQALAEYRERKVLGSLDTAQVDKVRFAYDNNPFALQKVGDKWQVEGKPALKVKEDAVREALGALAKLRAERYVVDKGADLVLDGLQPPLLTLEMSTPTAKHILAVGHAEGESKRYATVPETGGGAVFIIGEGDVSHIVRRLPDLLEKTAK